MNTTLPLNAAELKTLVTVESYFLVHGSAQDADGRWRCLRSACHTNGDAHASVTISKGRALCWSQNCFGDKGADIFAVVGVVEQLSDFKDQRQRVLELAGLHKTNSNGQGLGTIQQAYDYLDENGTLLYQTVRLQPKSFRQRRPDGKAGWLWNLKGVRNVLYRLPELAGQMAVYAVEGEKDCDRLWALGLPSTANAGGAEKWTDEHTLQLKAAGVHEVRILPDNDPPGQRHAQAVARSCVAAGLIVKLITLPNLPPRGDVSDFLDAGGMVAELNALADAAPPWVPEGAKTSEPMGRALYRRVADIQARPIRWLWPGRIARGKVSIIAGNPGLGKSQVTVGMAATVSTGGLWPVDGTPCEIGNVIVLSAEDDPADTIRPRLEVAGADLSKVYILDATLDGLLAGNETPRAFNLSTDLDKLGAMLEEIGGAALVVIDPITAYLGSTDSHKNAEVRALLSPLAELAGKHRAAVVAVSHFNKNANSEALMRVTGSLAFVAAARAAYVVAKDPENEARRLFLPLKNNLGNDRTGLAFTVQSAKVESSAGTIETSRVVWDSSAVTVTAEEAMRPQVHDDEEGALDDAKDFLRELLADGPVSSKQIRADVEGAGHSWRTIQRAQQALGIVAFKKGMKAGWSWRLGTPSHAEECQEPPKNAVPGDWKPSHSSGGVGGLQGELLESSEVVNDET